MSYNFYHSLHLGSLFFLALILGGLWGIYTKTPSDKKFRSWLLACHGLILFFLFLAGFGLMAKIKIPFPWPLWIYGKLSLWLVLGASPLLLKILSKKLPRAKFYFGSLICILLLFVLGLLLVKLKP